MQNEELIKWPFLKQTWGIEFEKSDGSRTSDAYSRTLMGAGPVVRIRQF